MNSNKIPLIERLGAALRRMTLEGEVARTTNAYGLDGDKVALTAAD